MEKKRFWKRQPTTTTTPARRLENTHKKGACFLPGSSGRHPERSLCRLRIGNYIHRQQDDNVSVTPASCVISNRDVEISLSLAAAATNSMGSTRKRAPTTAAACACSPVCTLLTHHVETIHVERHPHGHNEPVDELHEALDGPDFEQVGKEGVALGVQH